MGCGPSAITSKALDSAQPLPKYSTKVLPLESIEDYLGQVPSPTLQNLPLVPGSKKFSAQILPEPEPLPPDRTRTNAATSSPKNATKSKGKKYSFHQGKAVIPSENRPAEIGPPD
jgi:hypothetical protein